MGTRMKVMHCDVLHCTVLQQTVLQNVYVQLCTASYLELVLSSDGHLQDQGVGSQVADHHVTAPEQQQQQHGAVSQGQAVN
jgi:hypothetical protein